MLTSLRALKITAFIATACLLATALGMFILLLFSPTTLVAPLVKKMASSQGMILQKLEIGAPLRWGPKDGDRVFSLAVNNALVSYEGDSFEITQTEVTFTLRSLLSRRLESVVIAKAEIAALIGLTETEDSFQPTISAQLSPLFAAQQQVLALPLDSLSIDTVLITLRSEKNQSPRLNGYSSDASIHIPAEKIRLNIETEGEQFTLTASEINLEASTDLLGDAVGELAASNLSIICTRAERCAGELRVVLSALPTDGEWFSVQKTPDPGITAKANDNEEEPLQLKSLSLELPLTFDYQAGEIDLSSPLSTLRLGPWQTQSSSGELVFELSDFRAHLGRVSTIRGNINTTEATLNLAGVEINSPRLSASIYADTLDANAVAELSIAGTPFAGASIAHSFARDTGSLDLRVEPAGFSLTSPLSTLVNPPELQTLIGVADLVAGKLEVRIDLGWSRQQSGAWAWGGPLVAKIDAVSGFAGETLFVGASTEIFAELAHSQEQDFTLFTAQPALFSVASIDSGFEFQNIRLDYRFTLEPSNYNFMAKAIGADFLGGEITIPTFTLSNSSQNLDQEQAIHVVLSGVDLGSIVSLANYPEVVAQGSISGYLPLSLKQDENGSTVTVSEGLISALKPGGSIRYTPLGGITSGNQSIRLVNEALANYQFTTLDTTLELDEAGELSLGVVLSGSNPDMNAGQAINLNVNINDNLRSLLQSLQASRKLTEELEQRLKN